MEYALGKIKDSLRELLKPVIGTTVEIIIPPPHIKADLAVPLFSIAGQSKKNPKDLAQELASSLDLKGTVFTRVEAQGGFLNFTLNPLKFCPLVLQDYTHLGSDFGRLKIGEGTTIVIDYSAPNIAKPFSVGHLRSTIIGQALYNIFVFLGYKVVGDNHIGDWGTQFGKLMVAYKKWGQKEQIDADPIKELLKLYVKFHEEAKEEPALEDEARQWFKKLETGDKEARDLWQWFTEISWKEFNRIYKLLGVNFDEVLGESFYNDQLQATVEEAFGKGLAEWDAVPAQKAEAAGGIPGQADSVKDDQETSKVALIRLDKYGMEAPLLIQKSDGTSLYATRDLATAKYRIQRWKPKEIIYVVGGEQQLYFRQWLKVLELLGHKTKCVHVWFGLIRMAEGKMSTRQGRVIFLEEVLDEATRRAEEILQDRPMDEGEKKKTAQIIGIGAVKYADLSQNRTKDILFNWKTMLNLHGDSAPYLQYAYVRIKSLLEKAGVKAIDPDGVDGSLLTEEAEIALVKKLAQFPESIENAAREYFPHYIANYLFFLAQLFSTFYDQVPVIKTEDEKLKKTRLYLCQMTADVLKTGLGLLGIECPEQM